MAFNINNWLKFKQFVLPQDCQLCSVTLNAQGGLGCAQNDLGLCSSCAADLPLHDKNCCPQCALPSFDGAVCGDCLQSPPDFDATFALFTYSFPIDRMIQKLKYQSSLQLAKTFGQLLANRMHLTQQLCIIPMPLHPQRLKERGFNQSLEIAKVLATLTHYQLDYSSCERVKFSPPQASLPLKDRIKNMRNAFACHADLHRQHVLLLDDVMTTGASLNELAKICKKAGAASVSCAVIARTLPHR